MKDVTTTIINSITFIIADHYFVHSILSFIGLIIITTILNSMMHSLGQFWTKIKMLKFMKEI